MYEILRDKIKCLFKKIRHLEEDIQNIPSVDQNNKIVVLTIPQDSLSGEGTIEEQIAEWFNINGPISVDDKTNLVIEIDYPDTPVVEGKPFGVDTELVEYCKDTVKTNFSLTLYHKGEFDRPTYGDTIYTDQACSILFVTELPSEFSWSAQGYIPELGYRTIPFRTDNDGKLIELFCD